MAEVAMKSRSPSWPMATIDRSYSGLPTASEEIESRY